MTSSKLVAAMELPWTTEIIKVQLKNDNVQAFDTKWSEVISADTDRRTHSILNRLQDACCKVGRIEICVASPRSRDDIR